MKAMLLAAGRGERMRPLTDTVPKPLIPAGGKPLIVWTIEALAAAGFDDLVINVSHLGERIARTLGNGNCWGVRIEYSREAEALETAGGIAKALPLLGADPFLAVNADVYTDFPFAALARALSNASVDLAHLVLVENPTHHPGGDFALDGDRVTEEGAPRYTFSGIGVYRPELFEPVSAGSKYPLARLLRPRMTERRVSGRRYTGTWMDVGSPERLAMLESLLAANRPRRNC
jgi:MurNAc alpha-1-phosphate uridylyltransferase